MDYCSISPYIPPMIFQHTSYRTYLRSVLAERASQNPKYSLRAFARQLDLSPAILSQAMNKHRNLSSEMAFRVAQNLKLNGQEAEYFCLLAQYEAEKLPSLRDNLAERLSAARKRSPQAVAAFPRDLSVDAFKLISDWYHIPMVELTQLKGFTLTASNAAKRLGISNNEAELALDRLERLHLIERLPEQGYRKTNEDYDFGSPFMNDALNKFHKQMLAKASDATTAQARAERQISSNTFSIDKRLLPKAAALTANFRREMVELFNTSEENTETYHLGIQLFQITQPPTSQENLK